MFALILFAATLQFTANKGRQEPSMIFRLVIARPISRRSGETE